MNTTGNLLQSRWHEVREQVQQRWNKVTDDDLTKVNGKTEELAVVLQERYGYSKPQAVMEIFKWLQNRS